MNLNLKRRLSRLYVHFRSIRRSGEFEKLTKPQQDAVKIIRYQIRNKQSEVYMNPMENEIIITDHTADIHIFLAGTGARIVGGSSCYDIHLPERTIHNLRDYTILNVAIRRAKLKGEIISRIDSSVETLATKIFNKGKIPQKK